MSFTTSIMSELNTVSTSSSSIAVASIFQREPSENQIYLFTTYQTWMQRVLAISSSSTSIVFCLVSLYAFLAIDPRRLVFRHQLIAFLLSFDLLKAVVLLLYPSLALSYDLSYYDPTLCQVIGFFTAVAIEGADLAILALAIHTFLLIFKPNLSIRVGNSGFVEGGLFKYRYYVYGLSFVIPIVMASLAYINKLGYDSLICWCYLPRSPTWYRFVLSWVPRYIIVIIIITVYCVIYFHIIREFKVVGGMFTTMHRQRLQGRPNSFQHEKPSFLSAIKYFCRDMKDRIIPQFVLPEAKKHISTETTPSEYITSNAEDKDDENNTTKPNYGVDIENIMDDPEIQEQNLEQFKQRQKLIAKQMKSIFVYPFAYCSIWLFPFCLSITQVNYEQTHHPVYWLNYVSAFMMPFNGFVDTLVFFYREEPWKYTILKNFERENALRMSEMSHYDSLQDTNSLTTSTRFTKRSLSASMGLDINNSSKWRKVLNWLGLPFFQLPTEETIAAFHAKLVNGDIENIKADQSTEGIGNDGMTLQFHHDFSNILNVDVSENEFRSGLNRYSLNSSRNNMKSSENSHMSITNTLMGKRTNSNASSVRSPRSSRASFSDIGEAGNKSRNSSLSDLSQKNNINYHLSPNPNINKLVSYQKLKSKRGSTMPSHSPAVSHRHLDKRNNIRTANNFRAKSDTDEIDFMEFLKRGS